jgi:hypothetical protein
MHRVVMHIVESSPKVSFGLHWPFETVVPDFATALIIGTVPFKRRAAMILTNCVSQFSDSLGFYEYMVVIRKYAPRIYARTKVIANPENLCLALGHSLRVFANHWNVLVTRRGA